MTIKKYIFAGIFLGLSISFVTQVLTWFGLGLTNWFVLFTYLLVILCIVLVLRKPWLSGNKPIPIVHALIAVLIIIIISRYVFQLYMYLYITYIEPDWVNTVSIYWADMLAAQGASEENINAQIESFKHAYQPSQMFTIEIIKYGFSQFIVGLLASLYFIIKSPSK